MDQKAGVCLLEGQLVHLLWGHHLGLQLVVAATLKWFCSSPLCLTADLLPKPHTPSSFIFKVLLESSVVLEGMSINEQSECDHCYEDGGFMPPLFVSYCWILSPPIPHLCCLQHCKFFPAQNLLSNFSVKCLVYK